MIQKKERSTFFQMNEGSKSSTKIINDGKRIRLLYWMGAFIRFHITNYCGTTAWLVGNRWFIAVKHEVENLLYRAIDLTVGVDIGIKELVT